MLQSSRSSLTRTLRSALDIRTAAIMLLLGLAAVFVGCVRSTQPILKDDQVITDDSILGKWVSSDGKDHLEIFPPKPDDKAYEVHFAEADDEADVYQVKLGKVDAILIAQVNAAPPKGSELYQSHFLPLYSFVFVDQTKPNLVIAPLNTKWLAKYVTDHPGDLQLFAPVKKDDDPIIVTSSTQDWQNFVVKHYKDEGLIDDKTTFVRPGDPTTKTAGAK
jgi:hypothetical protein